ncbi:Retrovirus-related Pol polyprotein from transposon RE1 [Vitis vinifera]|uniref:Retrovirus-related Pol polyprotein from transposon RE1 n=1 Tax=Vitis vinifera TaxID=29760 RepID=A0A438BVZ5_VITVI|nr:Retrovirus-related Pol polyprotein from transposon RE1 [Vitis vinifera]
MEHLAELSLEGTLIKGLPSSIENLTGLALLNLKECKRLQSFPRSIFKLQSLKTLVLSNCTRLKKLPDMLENKESLKELFLDGSSVTDTKPVHTPMVIYQHLTSDDPAFSDPTLYRFLVGALQYLTITRPDIAHVVNSVSQFLHAPTAAHFLAIKCILRYVKGTLHFDLTFRPSTGPGALVAYSDADWVGCPDTRRSTFGYSIYLGNNLVSWSAKKQPTVSCSSCESEYCAIATTAAELLWLTHLLHDLKVPISPKPILMCDNKKCDLLKLQPHFPQTGKHVDLDYHFLRELVIAELKELPDDLGSLQCLVELNADGSGIQEDCELPSFLGLYSLRNLNLSGCNLLEGALPSDLSSLSSLEYLDLSRNDFITMPASLSGLPRLHTLALTYCRSLQSLLELPSSIARLDANHCTSLKTFSYPPSAYGLRNSRRLIFEISNCFQLVKNEQSDIVEAILLGIRLVASVTEISTSRSVDKHAQSQAFNKGEGTTSYVMTCHLTQPPIALRV